MTIKFLGYGRESVNLNRDRDICADTICFWFTLKASFLEFTGTEGHVTYKIKYYYYFLISL